MNTTHVCTRRRARRMNPALRAFGATVIVMLAAGPAAAAVLEEIVVTAQKREQSLQEVGIAVAAFTSEDVRTLRIQVPVDLGATIPNLEVKEINPGLMPVFTIRGVGLNDFSANNNPTVGVYVDEAFLTSTAQLAHQLYDLERIEVLKGPQGTLYGRNTTAGAINFITARPAFDDAFFVSGGYGSYETLEAEFMLNRPLSETVAFRVAAQTIQQGEGYWESRTLGGESIGERDILTGRAQLLWLASGDTTVNIKVEGARSDSELGQNEHFGTFALGVFPPVPCAPVLAGRIDPTQCGDLLGYSDPDGDPFEGDWNQDSESTYDQVGAVLTLDTVVAGLDVRSISSLQRYERTFLSDVDGSPFVQAEFEVNDTIEQFTQEIRASAALNERIDTLVGVFYSWDEVGTRTPGDATQLFATQVLITADQTTRSAATFANADVALDDDWVLTLGARFTWEDKEFSGGTTDLNPLGSSCILSPTCTPGLTGPVALSSQDDSIDDTNFSWKVGLNYEGWNDNLLYASIARGYKSGGYFGSGFTTSDAQLEPFDPEELTAYELGMKTRLLDDTLQLNASAFYYDYVDVQTFTALTDSAIVTLVLSNVDEAEITGFEADAWWRPLAGLDLRMAVGILDTELGAFVTSEGPVAKGNELPDAPELTFSTLARYEFPIAGDLRLSAQVDGSYTDQMYKEAVNRALLRARDYWLTNARLALHSADESWEVALWGKNLGDEQVITHAFDNGIGNGARIYQAPRTWGLTFTYWGR